jgi:hypothetical protein
MLGLPHKAKENAMKKITARLFTWSALLIGFYVFTLSAYGNGSPVSTASTSTPAYTQQAADGVQQMQTWYVQSSGLYQTPTGWWNSANAITVLVDYSRATNTTTYLSAVSNTFTSAQTSIGTNFITGSNDDNGWWALSSSNCRNLLGYPVLD